MTVIKRIQCDTCHIECKANRISIVLLTMKDKRLDFCDKDCLVKYFGG
jgi:hypothetical protein